MIKSDKASVRDIVTLILAVAVLVPILEINDCKAQQTSSSGTPAVTYLDQGWSAADRDTFYTTDQGSRMMQYSWFKALRRLDADLPFAADQLQRYGYLPSDQSKSNPFGLPVGFVVAGDAVSGDLGMTCAACHTAQLEYQKDAVTQLLLRIDGAPANADFQSFLTDLTATSRATLAQPERFQAFARDVFGDGYSEAKAAQLKIDFGAWVKQFGEFMDASLPPTPWGPGRLDAFGMIFNRVAGRDLGIMENFEIADAPVSYPFLWNASRQDHTQWNGGVPNGLYVQAIGRNTGEVFGVFASYKPHLRSLRLPNQPPVIYSENSADYAGLQTLEEKIVALNPPPWPRDIFGFDENLANRGKALFDTNCGGCHAEQQSPDVVHAWNTPILAVGTDPKMAVNAERISQSGILAGAPMPPPPIGATLADPAKTHDILANSVIGALVDEAFFPLTPGKVLQSGVWRAIWHDFADLFPDRTPGAFLSAKPTFAKVAEIQAQLKAKVIARLSNFYRPPVSPSAGAAYEARVLHGIWATAPYLHNGSVPNLWELLTPAKDRKATFMVGCRVFDSKNVGYSTEQSSCSNSTFVADATNTNGNGNGGHEYGTGLGDEDRWAIIEYLKKL